MTQARNAYTGVPATASPAIDPAAGQAPASNNDAVATLATPAAGLAWHLKQVNWSYSGAPTGGQLIIAWNDGSAQSETYYISSAGPGFLPFPPRRFPAGISVTITLKAGGSGVSGSVYPDAWVE